MLDNSDGPLHEPSMEARRSKIRLRQNASNFSGFTSRWPCYDFKICSFMLVSGTDFGLVAG